MLRTDSASSSGASLTSDEGIIRATTHPRAGPSEQKVKRHELPKQRLSIHDISECGGIDSPEFHPDPHPELDHAVNKFRKTVAKVAAMQKTSSTLRRKRAHGFEQGVDPRLESVQNYYKDLKEGCEIEVVDYSPSRATFTQFDNQAFLDFLESTQGARQPWVKVRWVNVGGISWDVLSALAIKYDLHPLALESILEARKSLRSKVDYYQNHLAIRIICHSLQEVEASPLQEAIGGAAIPLSAALVDEKPRGDLESASWSDTKLFGSSHGDKYETLTETRVEAAYRTNNALKESSDRVRVKVRHLFLFLCRDGTVISIHQADRGFGDPILARLRQRDTLLRTTADASLLLHGLLDLVVDRAIGVVDKFEESILHLERQVFTQLEPRTLRNLHVLSGDLTLHRRAIEPIRTLIYGLRRYDSDRTIAGTHISKRCSSKIAGFLTHQTRVYLSDVHDHLEFVISSLQKFESISENLINHTFNIVSYETNESIRRLMIVTIIFLPLTFVAGYFGMNFTYMMVTDNSDIWFWIIALPVLGILMTIFLWNDCIIVWHFVKKYSILRRLQM